MASIDVLLGLSNEKVMRMTEKELRQTVSQLASAANKRLARMGEDGTSAHRFAAGRVYTTQQGGKFGVKGKNINQLRNEYKAVRQFMEMKTSTAAGRREIEKKVEKRVGKKMSDGERKYFWETYRKLEEMNPTGVSTFGSTNVQREIAKIMKDNPLQDDLLNVMEKKINENYEVIREAYNDGEFFDIGDGSDEDDLPY